MFLEKLMLHLLAQELSGPLKVIICCTCVHTCIVCVCVLKSNMTVGASVKLGQTVATGRSEMC